MIPNNMHAMKPRCFGVFLSFMMATSSAWTFVGNVDKHNVALNATQIDKGAQFARVSLLVAAVKTASPRRSDTLVAVHAQKLKTVAQLVGLRLLDDAVFVSRTKYLARRINKQAQVRGAPKLARVKTGAEFLETLTLASRLGAIDNLVVYGHSAPTTLYMLEDRGFYRAVSEINKRTKAATESDLLKERELRALGARDLGDFEKLIKSGEIRFAKDSVVIFAGCRVAGDTEVDDFGIASRIAELTGAMTFASVDETDRSMANSRLGSSNEEFSRGTWVQFTRGRKPLNLFTKVIDPLKLLSHMIYPDLSVNRVEPLSNSETVRSVRTPAIQVAPVNP
jgi:hypothetical protein